MFYRNWRPLFQDLLYWISFKKLYRYGRGELTPEQWAAIARNEEATERYLENNHRSDNQIAIEERFTAQQQK